MRPLLLVLTSVALMALAFWAYRENYATQRVLREMEVLQADIAHLRESLAVQRAEWAYLNRPERLRDLVALNFERVPLLPLEPGQFQPVDEVALPLPPTPLQQMAPVDIQGTLSAEDPL